MRASRFNGVGAIVEGPKRKKLAEEAEKREQEELEESIKVSSSRTFGEVGLVRQYRVVYSMKGDWVKTRTRTFKVKENALELFRILKNRKAPDLHLNGYSYRWNLFPDKCTSVRLETRRIEEWEVL